MKKNKLTVNKEKSEVGRPTRNVVQVRPHIKAKKRHEGKMKNLTSRKRPGEIQRVQ
ncbi:hypothetical protein MM221_09780 [Salipaludibacillus sp. LMS25]|uniref:hypothetical protein n=1 Tax=Salipaludibacillus sp. LMS25 TaxID=2924031 RepID=UPI0020D16D8E|nr:hypothetical protein [Salipaludibacillus sp. LMS25]UTR16772.1 hypothetical protein MM221_09780 [Salipaludibacillus sp. LMS25]